MRDNNRIREPATGRCHVRCRCVWEAFKREFNTSRDPGRHRTEVKVVAPGAMMGAAAGFVLERPGGRAAAGAWSRVSGTGFL